MEKLKFKKITPANAIKALFQVSGDIGAKAVEAWGLGKDGCIYGLVAGNAGLEPAEAHGDFIRYETKPCGNCTGHLCEGHLCDACDCQKSVSH
jgi:hypothetical protein